MGNIASDANSAKKYWYFIRMMGRSPSHTVAECALRTKPNVVLLVCVCGPARRERMCTRSGGAAARTHARVVVAVPQGEDVLERRMTLADLTMRLADAVCARAAKGKNFGVVIVSEGLISCVFARPRWRGVPPLPA